MPPLPSGSSVAPPPARTSWTGVTLRTIRYASITPIGSLNRSNREIWTRSGRAGGRVGELGHREDACVLLFRECPQHLPDGPERTADVDVGAPDPLPLPTFAQLDQARGLGVVDDHDVRLLPHRPGSAEVPGGDVLVDLPVPAAHRHALSLAAAVDRR